MGEEWRNGTTGEGPVFPEGLQLKCHHSEIKVKREAMN